MSEIEDSKLTEIEKISAEEFVTKINKDLCYDVGNYPNYLIPEIFSKELKEIDLNIQKGQNTAPFILQLSMEERVSLEKRISTKAEELLKTYKNNSEAVKYHLSRAMDYFTEICLKLNPNGYFKNDLRLGIVENYDNGSDSHNPFTYQISGVRVRLIEKQEIQKPYKEHEEAIKILNELENRNLSNSESNAYNLIENIHELNITRLNWFDKLIKESASYGDIRAMLINSSLDITPINTTVSFFYSALKADKGWIRPGYLISILPSQKEIGEIGFTEVCTFISNNKN